MGGFKMTHKGTITLETERLILRRFTTDDADAMFRNWASDPEVARFMPYEPHKSIDESHRIVKQFMNDSLNTYKWAIVPKDFGEPIGTIGADTDDSLNMAYIGYDLGKAWWHQGYMSEACAAVIRFFFEQVGVNRVYSSHDPRNPHSGAVMRKCGMQYEGTLRHTRFRKGEYSDRATYGFLAEDYFAAQKPRKLTFAPYDIIADREFLAAAHTETFALTYHTEITPELLNAELAKPRDVRDGAYLNGKLVGICDLQRRSSEEYGDFCHISFFYIAPAFRDSGLGGQLITHAVDWCRKQGLGKILLRTGNDNLRARKCYEKNGFERTPNSDTGEQVGYVLRIEPFTVRLMTLSDYDAVYAMWLNTNGMGLNDVDDSRDGIAKFIIRNPNTNFVAEQGSEIVGAIMTGHDGRRGHIHHTAVRDDCRRSGIGSALVGAAMNALKMEGITKVSLVAFTRNEHGNAFWEAQGFSARADLTYRNKAIAELQRIDT
jgi:ribosomal-protein-alanine N-acetyltransferase